MLEVPPQQVVIDTTGAKVTVAIGVVVAPAAGNPRMERVERGSFSQIRTNVKWIRS